MLKSKRQKGEAYISLKGLHIQKKEPKSQSWKCTVERGFHCSQFSNEWRETVCHTYWELGEYCRKKDWLLKFVKEVSVKRRKVDAENRMNARRTRFIQCFLPNNESAEEQRVCKSFFGGTLCLGKCAKASINALNGSDGTGTFAGHDARGKQTYSME